MKSTAKRESQNRVAEAIRKLKMLLELKHSVGISTLDVSYYRSNLNGLEREIEVARSCGDTGPYITCMLDQLQAVRDQLFDCEMRLLHQEQSKINHKIELTRALRELTEALENTSLVMVNSISGRLIFTLKGFLSYLWLRFIGKEIKARYMVSMDYDLKSINQLLCAAKEKLEEGV